MNAAAQAGASPIPRHPRTAARSALIVMLS